LTEPDPIAALAAQLEELRGQLARYTGETGHLRARLEADSGQVLMLRLEVKKLGEKLDEAIGRRQAEDPPGTVLAGPVQGRDRGPARRAASLG
jgi:regulator of replication initiation timing